MRVYEIAKEVGIPNKDLIAKIRALGLEVNNHMSSLDADDVARIKRSLEKEKSSSSSKSETQRLSSGGAVLRRRSAGDKPTEVAQHDRNSVEEPPPPPPVRRVAERAAAPNAAAAPVARRRVAEPVAEHPAPPAAPAPAPAREHEPAPAPELPKRVVGKIAEVTPEPAGSALGPAPAPVPPEPPKSVAQAVEKPAELPAPPPPPKEFESAAITSVVASHRPAVLKCLAEGKKKNPSMKGTLTLQLVVALNGKIERSEVNSTLKDPLVAACVMKEARSWKFPVRNGGDPHAEIAYPFTIQ